MTRTGDPLVADDSFRLFLAGGFSGSFASFSLPALDPGLAWDTSTVNSDGWVRVVTSTAPLIGSVSIINGEIVVTGEVMMSRTGVSALERPMRITFRA